ncbi:GNAT family N-acetyltransferase [Gracilibacillus sp. YIM 98692]|uniref:GNAT family N-acetyltransferase n=1 Tax=Gracilibacillus sp. YIM 98692 TaxID=2663532 RepID=UPI0013D3DDEA|nr:GNAT family N-acetyltransferase [Gracilibacillus sp. YIM 98692]
MNSLIIREIKPGELAFVRKQRLENYKEYKTLLSREHWEGLKGTLSSDNDLKEGVKIFVAELDGKIIGSVVFFPPFLEAYEWEVEEQGYPEIRMLAVDQSVRGRGVGKKLVHHCIEAGKKSGYETIGLHTAEFMKHAFSLYINLGFIRVPEADFEPANDGIIVKGFKLDLKGKIRNVKK